MRDYSPDQTSQQSTEQGIPSDAQAGSRTSALPFSLPHKVACEWACVRVAAQAGALSAAHCAALPHSHAAICEKGLSPLQINVLALVFRVGGKVTPYARLVRQLADSFGMEQSVDSVRGVINRLGKRGFLRHRQSREGVLQGVCFTLVEALFCPYIVPVQATQRGIIPPTTHLGVQPAVSDSPTILEEIERKNLSISSVNCMKEKNRLEALTEDDMVFHWPELARQGFGTNQLRQIIQRREQINGSLQYILQGLTYAEWAFKHKCLLAAGGEEVRSPVNWVFNILAKQGYYSRPEGYASPEERAEQDRVLELAMRQKRQERHFEAELEAWLIALSPQERERIAPAGTNKLGGQSQHTLRTYFREQVWPALHK